MILFDHQFSNHQLLKVLTYWPVFTVLIEEWILTMECHLVKYHAQWKNINLWTSLLLKMNLRCHVKRSSFCWHVCNYFHIIHIFWQSKVCNLEISIVNENILRLYVSMNDSIIVKDFVSFAKLFQEEPNLLLWNVELFSNQILI